MDLRNFVKDIKIVPVANPVNANADVTCQVVDHLGYDRACYVVHYGAIVTNHVGQVYLTHADAASDENTLTSGANVSTSAIATADDDDNEVHVLDFGPSKRFSQLVIDKDATNAAFSSAICYLYNADSVPVTQATGNTVIGEGTGAVVSEIIALAATGSI